TIVTNQTTMSIYDTKEVMDKIVKINPRVIIVNEICKATQIRQEALLNLDDYDLVYVVGDHLSNNTNNLKKIASRSVNKVRLVESVMDIDDRDLKDINKVGVTAGASTPTYLTQQVITYLEKFPNVDKSDRVIDYSKII
ncbi:MAG TPA: 4-hydroxy-3-methylbut-2-enyl diphosphate reductase, partial [Erysipelotrichaceae bacterium]|nr:4-hydroxy-3-methylbut-2-enyl diphosphate reductase [Erysipelotrichaceae bacterium]